MDLVSPLLERIKHDIATRHIPVCVISTDEAREQLRARRRPATSDQTEFNDPEGSQDLTLLSGQVRPRRLPSSSQTTMSRPS